MSGVLFRLYGQHILLTEYQVECADSKVLLKIEMIATVTLANKHLRKITITHTIAWLMFKCYTRRIHVFYLFNLCLISYTHTTSDCQCHIDDILNGRFYYFDNSKAH